jgi:hypothetical protein
LSVHLLTGRDYVNQPSIQGNCGFADAPWCQKSNPTLYFKDCLRRAHNVIFCLSPFVCVHLREQFQDRAVLVRIYVEPPIAPPLSLTPTTRDQWPDDHTRKREGPSDPGSDYDEDDLLHMVDSSLDRST